MLPGNRLTKFASLFAAVALLQLIAACASAPPSTAQNIPLLTAAGFKTLLASTDRQLQQLPALPAGQVTAVTQTGKTLFVYPDYAKNHVYVGTEKQYRAYLTLRQQNNLPDVDPQASYFKQDAAMTATTARYAEVPYPDQWPAFGALVWE